MMGTLRPLSALWHLNWGCPTASVESAKHTCVCCPHGPAVATFSEDTSWQARIKEKTAAPFISPGEAAESDNFSGLS